MMKLTNGTLRTLNQRSDGTTGPPKRRGPPMQEIPDGRASQPQIAALLLAQRMQGMNAKNRDRHFKCLTPVQIGILNANYHQRALYCPLFCEPSTA